MTRLLAIIGLQRVERIDWNARLAASLKPNPQHLSRRAAAKRGHITRRNRQARG